MTSCARTRSARRSRDALGASPTSLLSAPGLRGPDRIRKSFGGFLRDTRAGATAIAAVAVTVMVVGGTALISDHLWLVEQRDVLKSAADAASVAVSLEMKGRSGQGLTDEALEAALMPTARRYILLNLSHLAPDRYTRAKESLTVTLAIDRVRNTVSVTAEADLGGTLFSRHLPLLGGYPGPETVQAKAETQCGDGLESLA